MKNNAPAWRLKTCTLYSKAPNRCERSEQALDW